MTSSAVRKADDQDFDPSPLHKHGMLKTKGDLIVSDNVNVPVLIDTIRAKLFLAPGLIEPIGDLFGKYKALTKAVLSNG